ncbi:MAG: hypothetical protein ACI4FX_10920 [Agathobacter sp.]
MADNDLIRRSDVLRLIEDVKSNPEIPKNYGTLLDILRRVREIPSLGQIPFKTENRKDRLTEKTGEGRYIIPADRLTSWDVSEKDGKVTAFSGDFAEKLGEFEDAAEAGRMVQIPVPVGHKVWSLFNGARILEYKVTGYSVDSDGAWLMYVEYTADNPDTTYANTLETEKIGETVFLSWAEAAEKLREKQ